MNIQGVSNLNVKKSRVMRESGEDTLEIRSDGNEVFTPIVSVSLANSRIRASRSLTKNHASLEISSRYYHTFLAI